jgi:hypothetical protein
VYFELEGFPSFTRDLKLTLTSMRLLWNCRNDAMQVVGDI